MVNGNVERALNDSKRIDDMAAATWTGMLATLVVTTFLTYKVFSLSGNWNLFVAFILSVGVGLAVAALPYGVYEFLRRRER